MAQQAGNDTRHNGLLTQQTLLTHFVIEADQLSSLLRCTVTTWNLTVSFRSHNFCGIMSPEKFKLKITKLTPFKIRPNLILPFTLPLYS
jgi:hypothetical protein